LLREEVDARESCLENKGDGAGAFAEKEQTVLFEANRMFVGVAA